MASLRLRVQAAAGSGSTAHSSGKPLPKQLTTGDLLVNLHILLQSVRGEPLTVIALDKAQGCIRSPGARNIVWEISWRIIVPGFENRRGCRPGRFDHVRSMKQTRVPDHAIVQQFFVTGGWLPVPKLVVTKIQLHRPCTNCWSRNFRANLKRNSFLRLNLEDQIIRRDRIRFMCRKQ